MHPNNIHNSPYDFDALVVAHQDLSNYLLINLYGNKSIDFSNNNAVLELNKAILKHHYRLDDWNIPKGYLCPPIPGRADYIHHIADLLGEDSIGHQIKGLDIGVGANCIYPILGSQIYNWKMVGVDINTAAVSAAQTNVDLTSNLKNNIEIRHQENNANIFEGVIKPKEYYHFSMCNPPFHSSEKEATKGTLRKLENLSSINTKAEPLVLNFGGQANELWCNGGEALFIKRMIKQSVNYKTQVGWFTSLVSKKDNLPKIHKQLNKLKAVHKTVEMSQGNKQSRFIAWKFPKE
ncbi:23S rRNA (adenine(1618)-N(6))-methyltransferase RlmF [uncultured Aquimarina sp.]|uniref:23S rRNA (adenine(1618)-N(6))-methyltransferase RlmF n=1 Tax=uncultured Aquimarina sp. TaxID=575652 RepID=UPI0026201033|nr:23S rRNA (adenine(1618)-N(6))-methyltransferase RlmF [uncultured Aquimarina sp.]